MAEGIADIKEVMGWSFLRGMSVITSHCISISVFIVLTGCEITPEI